MISVVFFKKNYYIVWSFPPSEIVSCFNFLIWSSLSMKGLAILMVLAGCPSLIFCYYFIAFFVFLNLIRVWVLGYWVLKF